MTVSNLSDSDRKAVRRVAKDEVRRVLAKIGRSSRFTDSEIDEFLGNGAVDPDLRDPLTGEVGRFASGCCEFHRLAP